MHKVALAAGVPVRAVRPSRRTSIAPYDHRAVRPSRRTTTTSYDHRVVRPPRRT
ncbi:hypothetical protein [Kribbella sp. NPDC048915]|uniref:hypothetical protein n=1 Tax=Kribbella sp. NPDC048915 TaxID=3155148 RepID=UPI0033ECBE63